MSNRHIPTKCRTTAIRVLLVLLCVVFPTQHTDAQGRHGFFYSIDAASSNIWTAVVLGTTAVGLSNYVPMSYTMYYDYLDFTEDGNDINWEYGNPIGFKSKDLFSLLRVGGKFGWLSKKSPVGLFVAVNYCTRSFEMHRRHDDYASKRFRLNSIEPEIGVRISPLVFMLEDYSFCPIFEFSSIYANNFKCKGGYDNDIKQFNDGVRTTYSIGVNFHSQSILLTFERPHYNLFNQSFSPDGGFYYPYANLKSKSWRLFLSVNVGF